MKMAVEVKKHFLFGCFRVVRGIITVKLKERNEFISATVTVDYKFTKVFKVWLAIDVILFFTTIILGVIGFLAEREIYKVEKKFIKDWIGDLDTGVCKYLKENQSG